MELTVYYDYENHVVIAVPAGPVTTENVKTTATKAIEFSKQYDCNFMLFDIRNCREGQPLIQGFYDMQDAGKTTGLSIFHKCAIVYDPVKYPDDRAQFIENVVANRPNPTIKMFKTTEAAHGWIRELKTP